MNPQTEPACYRCRHWRGTLLPVTPGDPPRCGLNYDREFPHIGCREKDTEAGTDWQEVTAGDRITAAKKGIQAENGK